MSAPDFDFEGMTLDEIETIENLTGNSIDKVVADGTPKGKNLKAIVFVVNKRHNPNYTIEDAGKVSIAEAMALFSGADLKKES